MGEVSRPAPLANNTEKRKRKVNKGSEIREEPAGQALHSAASQSDLPSSPLFPAEANMLSYRPPMPRGPQKPGDPAAPAAPSWDTEKSENRGESGMAILFMQSNGADN